MSDDEAEDYKIRVVIVKTSWCRRLFRRLGTQRILTYTLLALTASLAFSAPPTNKARAQVALSQPLTIRWRYDSNLTLNLTPAFDQERIYLPLAGGMLVSLRASDGQLYWRSEMGGELSASPVADDRAVYVASELGPETGKPEAGVRRATGTLRALGREGGVTSWMRTLAMPLRGGMTISGNKLIAGAGDGRLYAFDKGTGSLLWGTYLGGSFNSQPVVNGERIYAGNDDGSLVALEESSGKLLWRYRTKGPIRGPVALANSTVYFGSGDGYLYAVNAGDGRLLWRKRTGAGVEAVTMIDNALLVASLDNFVYRFSFNGSRAWKRQLPGRISAQPLTAEDGVLFTPLSSPAGVVLGPKDGKQVNSLPTGEEITTSAAPIAVGDAVLLTTQHGFLAFAPPKQSTTRNK
ncbi:MAG TPA: PQQ-binding-like beta-propeller repeat protein [Pyrinomonadaceae bacterium]|nr:PQQ-binding-like beta-propeller repeat protein [Pyrinomonadaceae bacterium]